MLLLLLLTLWAVPARADPGDTQVSSDAVKAAKSYYQSQKFERAISLLENVVRENPDDREAAQVLALSYYSVGKLSQAVPLLERLRSDLGPTGFDTSYLLGMCYLKAGQPDKARGLRPDVLRAAGMRCCPPALREDVGSRAARG